MRILTLTAIIGSSLVLSACQTTQDRATLSSFTSPSASGNISGDLSGNPTGVRIDSSGDGFAYTAGSIDGEGLSAQAGLVAGTTVNFHPSEGTGTYEGVYELVQVSAISVSGDRISGFTSPRNGTITLTADYLAGTLTGSADSLEVDGVMDGRTLGGTVTYRDVRGQLSGLVGGDKTVGAFHGNDEDLIYAGGFLANRD